MPITNEDEDHPPSASQQPSANQQPSEGGKPAVGRGYGPNGRLLVASAALSMWMILLLTGHAFGGAVHVLLLVSLASFPWRRGSEVGTVAEDASQPDEPATDRKGEGP